MGARVRTGGRLHFGFLNLSLTHGRLYGGLGAALATPTTVVTADRADGIECPPEAREYARYAATHLDVPGARIQIEDAIPQHVGLGSGTQLALAVYTAMAEAYDKPWNARAAAPALDRGGRSGIGVATFENGGFVLDVGHPVQRFTNDRPPRGEWAVPAVAARHTIPDEWRFLLVIPDLEPGLTGEPEDKTMRSVVENAEPDVANRISAVVTRDLLPAIGTGNLEGFGSAVSEVTRLNGIWYADAQGGVYRPPIGRLIDRLRAHPGITGVGQSSWGPTVYGVTHADNAAAASDNGEAALAAAGLDGDVLVVPARNTGADIETPS